MSESEKKDDFDPNGDYLPRRFGPTAWLMTTGASLINLAHVREIRYARRIAYESPAAVYADTTDDVVHTLYEGDVTECLAYLDRLRCELGVYCDDD